MPPKNANKPPRRQQRRRADNSTHDVALLAANVAELKSRLTASERTQYDNPKFMLNQLGYPAGDSRITPTDNAAVNSVLAESRKFLSLPQSRLHLQQVNQKLSSYVLSKFCLKWDPEFAHQIGLNSLNDWKKLNNPRVQERVLVAFLADNPYMDAAVSAVKPLVGGIPFVGPFLAPAVDWVGDQVGQWLGLDDQPSVTVQPQGSMMMPSKIEELKVPDHLQTMQNHMSYGPGAASYTSVGNPHTFLINSSSDFDIQSVSKDYIATILCPEEGPSRMPINNCVPTAMSHATVQLPFYTDSQGNGMVVFFPYAVGSDANSTRVVTTLVPSGNAFVMNDAYGMFVPPDNTYGYKGQAGFNPDTGAYNLGAKTSLTLSQTPADPGIRFIQGPLAATASNLEQLMAGPQSFKFVATIPTLQDQGQLESCIFYRAPNVSFTTDATHGSIVYQGSTAQVIADSPFAQPTFIPILSSVELRQQKFYQMSSLNKNSTMRMVFTPSINDNVMWQVPTDEVFGSTRRQQRYPDAAVYFVVRGAQPNTQVGNIQISYNAEFTPTSASLPICPVEYPSPGPRTPELVQALLQSFPAFVTMQPEQASALSELVRKCHSHKYTDILDLLSARLYGSPMRKKPLIMNMESGVVNQLIEGDDDVESYLNNSVMLQPPVYQLILYRIPNFA